MVLLELLGRADALSFDSRLQGLNYQQPWGLRTTNKVPPFDIATSTSLLFIPEFLNSCSYWIYLLR
jgi:hypothetical protein